MDKKLKITFITGTIVLVSMIIGNTFYLNHRFNGVLKHLDKFDTIKFERGLK